MLAGISLAKSGPIAEELEEIPRPGQANFEGVDPYRAARRIRYIDKVCASNAECDDDIPDLCD